VTWKERAQLHRFSSKEFESRLCSEIPTCFFDENFSETCCSLNSQVITDETVLRAHSAILGLGDGGYWLSYPIKAFGQDEYRTGDRCDRFFLGHEPRKCD
jgi:hypothetical protein